LKDEQIGPSEKAVELPMTGRSDKFEMRQQKKETAGLRVCDLTNMHFHFHIFRLKLKWLVDRQLVEFSNEMF
jgi:hypothetical protein